jgi:predicted dienelactone hydrolase
VSVSARAVGLLAASLVVPTQAWAGSPCRRAPIRDTVFFATPGSHGVGVRTLHLVDDTRPLPANQAFPGAPARPLDTEVWYPAAATGSGALRDAPLDRSAAPYPLILYGHALSDHRRGEAYLTEHLASHGFVVAAVDFPLGKIGAPGGATPADIANQPGDLRAVLDQLLGGAGGFADALDGERVGASGLSLGAATVLLLTYHRDLRDIRIRAVLPLAPPFSCAFTRGFYRGVRVPLLLVHGDADALVTLEENSRRVFARARGARTLVTLRGGSHLGFTGFATALPPDEIDVLGCTVLLSTVGPEPALPALPGGRRAGISTDPGACAPPCRTPVVGPILDATRQHDLTRAVSAAFFASALNDDPGARCWLARGLARENADVRATSRRH